MSKIFRRNRNIAKCLWLGAPTFWRRDSENVTYKHNIINVVLKHCILLLLVLFQDIYDRNSLKYFCCWFFLNAQSQTRIARDVIPVHPDRGYCVISKRTPRCDNRNTSLAYLKTYTQDKYNARRFLLPKHASVSITRILLGS